MRNANEPAVWHHKYRMVDSAMLERVFDNLLQKYGPGIFAVINGVRVVDNLSVSYDAKKGVLILGVDAFRDEEVLSAAVEYSMRDSIVSIVPCDFSNIRVLKDAENRYKAALSVFNDIAEAKKMASKVKETAKRIDTKIKGLSDSIRKIRMVISNKPVWELGFVDALVKSNKYILLDREELDKPENRHIKDWVSKITAGKEKSPFVYSMPLGVKREDVIDLREPEKVNDYLPQDRLYLPLPYSVSSIYLASQVVLVGGKVSEITDKLVPNTIRALYEVLLGKDVADSELEQLFKTPWTVLPAIEKITGALNAMRKAIQQIEMAA